MYIKILETLAKKYEYWIGSLGEGVDFKIN